MAQDLTKDYANFTDGVYRAAFPAYRVFIYGKEVTQDVIEVRVNNSGGSLERTPGGCSFTLVNPSDRYIINHSDMMVIAKERSNIVSQLSSEPEDSEVSYLGSEGFDSFSGGLAEETIGISKDSPALNSKSIKQEVLYSKMRVNRIGKEQKSSSIIKYKQEVVFDYPMQEGDCIFHANDPVRVVFRDPFDPRVWYWMFSGFMDAFTENRGVNKESTVTINCTDVSKSLRYSILNIDPGTLDQDVAEALKDSENAAVTGININKELFVGLNIYEILEILFFGTDSWRKGQQTEAVLKTINLMDDTEIINYLVANVPSYTSDVINSIGSDVFTINAKILSDADRKKYRQVIQSLMISRGLGLDRVNNSSFKRDLPMVSSPHDVKFKRFSDTSGLSAYYVGIIQNVAESNIENLAQQLPDLKSWNDIVYHRVRPQDWYDMAVEGYSGNPPPNISDVGYGLDVISNIITVIGTDTKNFPVGGGRVFYLTQAQLTEDLGVYAVDKSLASGSVVTHSVFLDRLTLLYDLSDRVDFFRFYATPRGDIVFELAFYDYDAEQFINNKDIVSVYDPASFMLSHQDIFNEAYTGKYSTEEAQALTSQNLTIQGNITGYTPINWNNQPVVDYLKESTIEPYEQISYSYSNTDDGVVTLGVCVKHTLGNLSSVDDSNLYASKSSSQRGLIPTLGTRVWLADSLSFIDTYDGAEIYASLGLRRRNAEMRNMDISTTPKFGIMVNRPILWKYRNCSANVVNVSHSIVWNNDCSTRVGVNSIRGWSGKVDSSGRPVREYFGGDYPFNPSEFVKKAIDPRNKGSGKGDQ